MPQLKKIRVRWYPQRGCRDCEGSGFVTVTERPRAVRKCKCWRRVEFGGPKRTFADGKMLAAEGLER